jgi:uncharacterized membrane protein YfcA
VSDDLRPGQVAVAERPSTRAEPTEPTGRPRRSHKARLGAIGLAGGFLSGLLGVGGGVIMVPLLVLWARFGQREAHAASLGAIIPISAAGVLTFGAAGEIRVGYAVALALGAVVGAQVGARALARASERSLKLAFGAFLVLVAVVMAVSG